LKHYLIYKKTTLLKSSFVKIMKQLNSTVDEKKKKIYWNSSLNTTIDISQILSLALRCGFTSPKRKTHNKIWATIGSQRPCIAKRTMSIKKVMYVIFFTNQGHAIQIAVPKGSKTPCWKKTSKAKKSRFGYFPVSEQCASRRLWKRI
jgi:hypothetical protein